MSASAQSSRTKSFLQNAFWSLALQLVTIVVGLITPRMIIHTYGSTANGLVSSLTQFVSYFSLVEAGVSAAAIYMLYKPLAASDERRISGILHAAKRFYYKAGWVFLLLIAVLAAVYPLLVDCGDFGHVQVAVLVFALGFSGVVDFFTLAKYRVLLTASQRNWVIQIASIVYKALNCVCIVIMVSMRLPLEIVYLAAILPVLVRSAILTLYTKRHFPNYFENNGDSRIKIEQSWDAFYLQLLGVVQNGAPLLIATFLLQDLRIVSVMSVYLMIANAVQGLGSSVGTGTQATFGSVIAKGEATTLKRAYREFEALSYTLTAVMCATALVTIDPFVSLYSQGADYSYVQPMLGLLVIVNVFLYHLKTPQGLLVISAGKYHETRVQTTVQTVVLILGAIVFGLLWGAPGILVGSCLSNLYRDIDLMFFIPRRVVHTRVLETARCMIASVLQFAVSVLPFTVMGHFIDASVDSWAYWLLLFAVSISWSAVCGVLRCLAFEREQASAILKSLRRM